ERPVRRRGVSVPRGSISATAAQILAALKSRKSEVDVVGIREAPDQLGIGLVVIGRRQILRDPEMRGNVPIRDGRQLKDVGFPSANGLMECVIGSRLENTPGRTPKRGDVGG